ATGGEREEGTAEEHLDCIHWILSSSDKDVTREYSKHRRSPTRPLSRPGRASAAWSLAGHTAYQPVKPRDRVADRATLADRTWCATLRATLREAIAPGLLHAAAGYARTRPSAAR